MFVGDDVFVFAIHVRFTGTQEGQQCHRRGTAFRRNIATRIA